MLMKSIGSAELFLVFSLSIPTSAWSEEPSPSADAPIEALRDKAEGAGADSQSWIQLGDALMQKSRNSPENKLYVEAEACYRKALDLEENAVDAMLGLAWVYNTRHEFEKGCRWAREAIALNPRLAQAHSLLGDAAVEHGQYKAAFEHYQQALDIRPDLSSYSRAAHLLWLTGDAQRGRWLMRKAVAAGSPHAEHRAWCRAELAKMLFHDGNLQMAEREAELALKEAPENHHVLAVSARIRMAKKNYPTAIDLYHRAVRQFPTHDAMVALGDLYKLTGDEEKAKEQYRRVVELHEQESVHTHDGVTHTHAHEHGNAQLARFYADHDRELSLALQEAKSAYETFPNIFVTDTLAWCYYKAGQFEEAEKTIAEVLKWNPPLADVYFHAGMIYAGLKERPRAQKFLYQALSLNPHFDHSSAKLAADTLMALAADTHRNNASPE